MTEPKDLAEGIWWEKTVEYAFVAEAAKNVSSTSRRRSPGLLSGKVQTPSSMLTRLLELLRPDRA